LNALLGGNLVGVYLHGSSVLGDWDEARSDVDLLAVSTGPVSGPERRAVARELVSLPWPGVGLEFSLMTRGVAERPPDPPPFEVHVATADATSVVEGSGRAGDPDLLIHVLMTRRAGAAILGPSPEIVFGEPPRAAALLAIEEDLRWALDRRKLGYAVLNACRAVRFLKDDRVSSKLDAGAWAIEHRAAPASLVREAMAERRGARANIAPSDAAEFVERTRALLRRAAASS
jgi:streptomycin 3"-adenylyltransferase